MSGNSLDLDIDIEEDDSDDSSFNSDIDDGEVGEMETEGEGGEGNDDDDGHTHRDRDGGEGTAPVLPRAYQHEPEPRDNGGGNGGDGEREARPMADMSRLDPNNIDNWCRCNHCEVLPSFTVGDCTCCQEIDEVVAETDVNNVICITQAEDFSAAILSPVTLYIAWQYFTDRWRKQAKSFGARNNEKYRYVAYRQFVRWCWGYLGRHVRVQLPACVLAAIRNAYPDGANTYRGTKLRVLDIE